MQETLNLSLPTLQVFQIMTIYLLVLMLKHTEEITIHSSEKNSDE